MHHQIEVYCRADAIPEHIAVSLAGMNINDSVHMKSLTLPEGVTATDTSDFTVASLAAPGGGSDAAA